MPNILEGLEGIRVDSFMQIYTENIDTILDDLPKVGSHRGGSSSSDLY